MNPSSPSLLPPSPEQPPVRLSVIIPSCRRPKSLAQCLEALAPGIQTLPGADYEVIVTDDSPPDESLEPLIRSRFPWVRWTAGPRRGPSTNRNHGARQARAPWLVFVDDDCIPDPQWLNAFLQTIQGDPSHRVLEGRTYADRQQKTLAEAAPLNENGGVLWSCNFAIDRAFFEEIGGFDERFRFAAMEDVELRHRIQDHQVALTFVREAAVCHPWRPIDPVRELQRHRDSVKVFVSIRPAAAAQFGFFRTFDITMRTIVKHTLPTALRLRGAGFISAMFAHAYVIYLAATQPVKVTAKPQP